MTQKEKPIEELPLFAGLKKEGASDASVASTKKPQTRPRAASGATAVKEKYIDKAQAGREDKRRAEHAKEAAYRLEQKNHGWIIVYRSTRGWWKMGDLSAAIYAHLVAKRLGRKKRPNILTDGDFYNKFKMGVCAIPDIEKLEAELKKIGIPVREKTDDYRIFDYGKKFSQREVEDLINISQNQQERINEIVMHEQMFPEIYHLLIQIQREVLNIVRKLPRLEKDVFGRDMLMGTREAVIIYMKMTNNIMKAVDALPRIVDDMTMVTFGLKDLTEQDMLEKRRCLRVLTMILDVKKMAKSEIRRCAQKT